MNFNYFDTWSCEMAYFLGWIWADGSISSDMKKLQLGCVTEDEELIIEFLNAIESNHKVIRTPSCKIKNYITKPYTKVAVYGKPLILVLVEKHGVLPRKTYSNPPFPPMDKQFISSFIRGYFDGDGSVFLNKKGEVGISVIGTKDFIQGMCDAIHYCTGLPTRPTVKNKSVKTNNAGWFFNINRQVEVLTFLKFMYQGDKPCLKRKKLFADQCAKQLVARCKLRGITQHGKRIRLRFLNKNIGDFESLEECIVARNSVHELKFGYPYPC